MERRYSLQWYLHTPLYAFRKSKALSQQYLGQFNLRAFQARFAQTSNTREDFTKGGLLKSCLCNQKDLDSEALSTWLDTLAHPTASVSNRQRKTWEWCFIAQALSERELLQHSKRGLGFAVGTEPLPAFLASRGCEIVATDLSSDDREAAAWQETNQHASNLEELNAKGLCDEEKFKQLVSFRSVDMNHIPADLKQSQFDFVWSSCSLEHLGSLSKGMAFIESSLECLKPGGIAVHTTEFNLSSNLFTVDNQQTVIYRRRDIEALAKRLRARGHQIELDFTQGQAPADKFVDVPPYQSDNHLRLLLSGYVCTSIGLIIRKAW